MLSRFLYYILQFRGLIILTMVSLIIVTAVLIILMKDFAWNRKHHLMVMTLFFNMEPRYMVYLAANYIQMMFVFSMLLTSQDVQISHLVLLLILGLIQAVAIDQPAESIRSLLGCALLYIAFLIVDLLKTYIFEMRFDWRIAFVCGMLYVFLILYALYFFINGIKCLASRADLEEIGGVKRKSTEYTDGYRVDMTELSETDELEDAEDTP